MTTTAHPPLAEPPDQSPPADRRRHLLTAALLAAAVVLVFGRALWNGFVNYDDPVYVTEADVVRRGLTADGVAWAFSGFRFYNWHPLTWVSHMLDVELFGLNPAGHHLTSVLLHAASTALLFVALRRMTGQAGPSAFAAALFGLHPLHVESVAWVAERKDVLCAFLAILTLIAYERYARRPSVGRYLLALLAFALGLLAKQMIVTLPFALLLLDYWPLRRMTDWRSVARLAAEKIPFLLLAAAASAVIFVAQASGDPLKSAEQFPIAGRLANAPLAAVAYLLRTVWPADLAPFYPYPASFPAGRVAAAAAALLALTAAAVWLGRRRPYLPVGWFWFVGMLVPVIGLVQVGRQAMADRYTYLPHVGLFVAVVWGVRDVARRWPNGPRAAAWAGGVVLVALAARTWHQLGYWQDSATLFTHAAAVTDRNYIAHHQLANELARQNRLDEAEHHYEEALRFEPDHALSHLNLGRVYARRGRYDVAAAALRRADELRPGRAGTLVSLGVVLGRAGDPAGAEAAFARAVELDPKQAQARHQWGLLLRRLNRPAAAAEQFRAALRIDPQLRDAEDALADLNREAATRPTSRPVAGST